MFKMTTNRKISLDNDSADFHETEFLDPLGDAIEEEVLEPLPKKIRLVKQPSKDFSILEKELIFDTIGNVDTRLTNIEQMLMEMKTQLDDFCTQETTTNTIQSSFTYEFPLKTADDLKSLEQNLSDPDFFIEMVKYMRKRKSADNNDINKILCCLINDEISYTYNYDGVQNKNSFKALRLSAVFLEAWVSDMFCLEEYTTEVKKYLHKCRNRISKRNCVRNKMVSAFD